MNTPEPTASTPIAVTNRRWLPRDGKPSRCSTRPSSDLGPGARAMSTGRGALGSAHDLLDRGPLRRRRVVGRGRRLQVPGGRLGRAGRGRRGRRHRHPGRRQRRLQGPGPRPPRRRRHRAEVALQRLLEEDDGRDHRQVGIVDVDGDAATHTGHACLDWAGGATGAGYAIQGNVLTGEEVVAAMEDAWLAAGPDAPLARRAARRAGRRRRRRRRPARADSPPRCSWSATGPGTAGSTTSRSTCGSTTTRPRCTELARLLDLNDLYLTASTEEEKVPVDRRAGRGARGRAPRPLGQRDFHAWVGTENYEMRVAADGVVDRPAGPRICSATARQGRRPMSVLAIDAGTTGVTAVVVTAQGTHRRQGLPGVRPALPAAGLGRARPRGDLAGHAARRPARSWRRYDASRAAGRRHHQPARDRRCCGTARRSASPRRAIVWQDRRTADICTAPARRRATRTGSPS